MLHLLFDQRANRFIGEYEVNQGMIRSFKMDTTMESGKWQALLQRYEREGIPCRILFKEITPNQSTTRFVKEHIPFSSWRAVPALVEALNNRGIVTYIVEPVRISYWRQIEGWPLTHAMKRQLFSLVQKVPVARLPIWDREWQMLALQMQAEMI